MPTIAVSGDITNPFHTKDAIALGLSLGLPSNSDARMALSSEAKTSDHSPPGSVFRARYSGLIPNGSRAITSLRSLVSQKANANIPRSQRMAWLPCMLKARSITTVSPVDRKLCPFADS